MLKIVKYKEFQLQLPPPCPQFYLVILPHSGGNRVLCAMRGLGLICKYVRTESELASH